MIETLPGLTGLDKRKTKVPLSPVVHVAAILIDGHAVFIDIHISLDKVVRLGVVVRGSKGSGVV